MSDQVIIASLWLVPALAVLVTAWGAWKLRGALRERIAAPGRPTAFLDWCWRLFDRAAERRRDAAAAAQVDRALRTATQLATVAVTYTLLTQPAGADVIRRQTAALERAIAVWRAA